ncbi:MAG: hypothetical protein EAZ43_13020 [Betaproteobacteria bacterium]|nr:MAG: hypothetical protein EAZ43_13020 [Betaproteobacteria bacterium]
MIQHEIQSLAPRVFIVTSAFLVAMSSSMLRAKELVVTHVAPFGGALAAGARDFNFGAQIALAEANAAGGVNGHTFRLVSRDDGNRAVETQRLLKASVQNDAPIAAIGLTNQAGVDALQKENFFANSRLPVIAPRVSGTELRDDPWLFHVRSSKRDELIKMTAQLQSLFRTRIAIVTEDDQAGRDAAKAFVDAAKELGIAVVGSATFPANSLDFDQTIQRINAAKPDAVLISASTNASAVFIKKYRPDNRSVQVVVTSAAEPEIIVEQVGKELARGVGLTTVMPNPARLSPAIASDFRRAVEQFKLTGIGRVNFSSMEGYVAARLLIAATRRAGSNPDGSSIKAALDAMRRVDLSGYFVEFDAARRNRAALSELIVIGRDGALLQ